MNQEQTNAESLFDTHPRYEFMNMKKRRLEMSQDLGISSEDLLDTLTVSMYYEGSHNEGAQVAEIGVDVAEKLLERASKSSDTLASFKEYLRSYSGCFINEEHLGVYIFSLCTGMSDVLPTENPEHLYPHANKRKGDMDHYKISGACFGVAEFALIGDRFIADQDLVAIEGFYATKGCLSDGGVEVITDRGGVKACRRLLLFGDANYPKA